jgi:hypothetical protein
LPWIALALGVLIIVIALLVFFVNLQRSNAPVAVATPVPATRAPTLGPPPTFTPVPTVAQPSPTPLPRPTPTSVPVATPATQVAAPTPVPPTAAAAATPPAVAAPPQPAGTAPTQPAATATTLPAAAPTPPPPTAAPTVTAQVSGPGGLGNTRADLDAAYATPTGERPSGLVVYRKDSTEYRAQFTATDPPRAQLLIRIPPQNAPLQLNAAQTESRQLMPRDAQPRATQSDGNPDFVVERFSSATLGRALPLDVFQRARGQAGDFIVVYLRNPQGAVTRVVLAAGDDVDAARARGAE